MLDEQLSEIAAPGPHSRCREGPSGAGPCRLCEINAQAAFPAAQLASSVVACCVALFNQRDWDCLRRCSRTTSNSAIPHPVRTGSADVGMFFGIYSKLGPVWLVPAWLEAAR